MQYELLHPKAQVPAQSYEEAAGYDLYAFIRTETDKESSTHIAPSTTKMIRTGLILAPPPGFFIMICSRSGLAAHNPPIIVANAPGIVDPDYRGEIKVILLNAGMSVYTIQNGERIAQALLIPITRKPLVEAKLSEQHTLRGDKGFGSTGL